MSSKIVSVVSLIRKIDTQNGWTEEGEQKIEELLSDIDNSYPICLDTSFEKLRRCFNPKGDLPEADFHFILGKVRILIDTQWI